MVELARTVAADGTSSALALFVDTRMETFVCTALLTVAVQVVLPPRSSLRELHRSEEMEIGGPRTNEADCELTPSVALITTVWATLTAPAVAVNMALLEPAKTVTAAGTVTIVALLLSDTLVLDCAVLFKVTVQVELPGVNKASRSQVNALTLGGPLVTVMMPPRPVVGISTPDADAPTVFVTVIEVLAVMLGDRVAVTTAVMPFGRVFWLMPINMHRLDPTVFVQKTDLSPAEETEPVETEIATMSEGE